METMATGARRILGLLVLLISISLSVSQDSVRLPPSLVLGSTTLIHYKATSNVTLHCVGVGVPTPTWEWTKNGQPLNLNVPNILQIPGVGIMIYPCYDVDQGYYQCKLNNAYGATMSNMTFVQTATLQTFSPPINIAESRVDINGNTCLACEKLQSTPAANIYWTYNFTGQTTPPNPVIESSKIQTNPFTGDLCLTHVQIEDSTSTTATKIYICNAQNTVLSRIDSGSYTRIVSTGFTVASYAPLFTFGSASTLIGLEGDKITLRVFFSGSPIPTLVWRKNGQTPPQNRWTVTNSGTGLTLTASGGLTAEDAGEYTCVGTNSMGSQTYTIQLTIQARPIFLDITLQPHDMNVTDGQTVTVTCDSHAIPPATVTWFKNGVVFTAGSLPPKFSMSPNEKAVKITGVCKTCYEGYSGDLMNIQCNASNEYGYSFVQGYVNVLVATMIISTGGDRPWIPYANEIFECQATSDASTTVARQWYFNDVILQQSETVVIGVDGSLHLLMQNDTDGGAARVGQYKCVASNGFIAGSSGYSEAQVIYTLGTAYGGLRLFKRQNKKLRHIMNP